MLEVTGPYKVRAKRDELLTSTALPIDIDPEPHKDNPNGECLVAIFGMEDGVPDVDGPYVDDEELLNSMSEYLRSAAHSVAGLKLRDGRVAHSIYLTTEESDSVQRQFWRPHAVHEPEMDNVRLPHRQSEPVAAAFEVIKGTKNPHFIYGWHSQLEEVLKIALEDAERHEEGQTVKCRHEVEIFVASDLGLGEPREARCAEGKPIPGVYYTKVAEGFEDPTLDYDEPFEELLDLGWETFIYSNGKTIRFYGIDYKSRRIDTRPVSISDLKEIVQQIRT